MCRLALCDPEVGSRYWWWVQTLWKLLVDQKAACPAVLDASVDLQTEPLQIAGFQISKNKSIYFNTARSSGKLLNSQYPVHQESGLKKLTHFILFCFYSQESTLHCYLHWLSYHCKLVINWTLCCLLCNYIKTICTAMKLWWVRFQLLVCLFVSWVLLASCRQTTKDAQENSNQNCVKVWKESLWMENRGFIYLLNCNKIQLSCEVNLESWTGCFIPEK